MAKADMTKAQQDYNFPPPPKGGMNLWIAEPGGVPEGLLGLAERFHSTIKLGTVAPDFTGSLLDGGEFTLSSLRNRRIACLIFGSLCDPPLISNLDTVNPSVNGLHRKYFRQGVEFIFVYTREAHPGSRIPQHESLESKQSRARQLKNQENILFPIVVDSLDGAIHTLYGQFTNPVFVINRAGVVIAKSAFLDTALLDNVLDDAVAWAAVDDGKTVVKKGYHERIHMCRAPYDPAGRDKERQALEASGGPEAIERIRQHAGFDPLTWQKTR